MTTFVTFVSMGGTVMPQHQDTRESRRQRRVREVVRGGVEPPTFRFSVGRSYQLSYLTMSPRGEAELTGFEPATFTLTG